MKRGWEWAKRILEKFDLTLERRSRLVSAQKSILTEKENLLSIYEVLIKPHKQEGQYLTECIVFSMDRALQLHALFSSYIEKVTNPPSIHLLYRATTSAHQKAYEETVSLFSHMLASVKRQNSEGAFRDSLLDLLESIRADKMFFLVDDDLFIEDVDISDFAKYETRTFIPSLRMGLHLKRCYTWQTEQSLPQFTPALIQDPDKVCWRWDGGDYDWGYPLSLDGHLFSTEEVLVMAKNTKFNGPNSFEASIHKTFGSLFARRYGVCYRKAKIVNIVCNKVQEEYDNIHGKAHQDVLLEKWNKGLQIDYRKYYGMTNEAVHQELDLDYQTRK